MPLKRNTLKMMTLNYFDNTMNQSAIRKVILTSGLVLPIFITGCTGLSGTQPPAPVYSNNHPFNTPLPSTQRQPVVAPPVVKEEIVQVQPLQESMPIEQVEIKAEPLAQPEPIAAEIHKPASVGTVLAVPKVIEIAPPTKHLLMPTPPTETGVPKFEPAPPLEFKPAESTTEQSPAVTALVSSANKSSNTGDVESAAAAIERAIRIEPRNGDLFYKLAVLRLKQSKPILAEDLARKSALLAGKNNTLKKNSWLLIAHSKEMQGDNAGADEARTKAASF